MASFNPALRMGLGEHKGSIEPGKDADLCILDPVTGEVWATLIAGKTIYKR
jgi:N-acetylglucosamine-6-phosphate deacetylase